MAQLLKLYDGSVALDYFRANARLAERCRALGQAKQTVELRDDADDGHPGRVVLVELAVQLRGSTGGQCGSTTIRDMREELALNWKSLTTICLRSRASFRSEMRRVVSGV